MVPSVTAEAKYNDNIYYRDENKEEDIIIVISPGIEVRNRVERGTISVKGRAYSYTYADNSTLDSVDTEIAAEGQYAVSRVVFVNGSVKYVQDHQIDRDITSTGQVASSFERENLQASAGASWALSEKTTVGAQLSLGQRTYDDPDTSDVDTQSVTLSYSTNLSKWFNETTGLAYLSHSRYNYESSLVKYTSLTIGSEKRFDEKYSILATFGPSFVQTEYDNFSIFDSEEWGVAARLQLDGRISEGTRFDIFLSHKVEPDSYGETTVVRTGLKGNYWSRISNDLSFGLSASYFHNESSGDSSFDVYEDEDTFNFSPRLKYKITDDLDLELAYRYSLQKDNERGEDKDQNSIFFRLIWSHRYGDDDLAYALN